MRVLIPSPLFSYTGGRAEVDAAGATVDEVLFWVSARPAPDVSAAVGASDEVMIVTALSGG